MYSLRQDTHPKFGVLVKPKKKPSFGSISGLGFKVNKQFKRKNYDTHIRIPLD